MNTPIASGKVQFPNFAKEAMTEELSPYEELRTIIVPEQVLVVATTSCFSCLI